jgi:hypothetical protein
MKAPLLCVVLAFALTSGCAHRHSMGASSGDHNILTGGPVTGTRLSDLPQPVKDTLQKQVRSGEVADIDKQMLGNEVVYKISFTDSTNSPALYIAKDGRIVQGRTNRNEHENESD